MKSLVKKFVDSLHDHMWLWFLPTIGMTLLATAYALVREPNWRATQALVVREETNAAEGTSRSLSERRQYEDRPGGRFSKWLAARRQ